MSKLINSTQAIFAALMSGRIISQMDSHEFQVADVRTLVSHMQDSWKDTHILHKGWTKTPLGTRVRTYQLERIAES